MLYFDPMYLVFALPALLLAFYAQFKVQSAYKKYLKVGNAQRLTGAQVAQRLIDQAGLYGVSVEGTSGQLSDHYDPRSKTLRLSEGVARSASVASMAIVAHEVGHAVQDAKAYAPLKIRGAIVPTVQIGSWLGPILFLVGFFFLGSTTLAWIGVGLFGLVALFSLVTLPVEFNASSRALAMLRSSGLVVSEQEAKGAKKVLDAAALTYVAALAQALSTMLYYVFLLTGANRD